MEMEMELNMETETELNSKEEQKRPQRLRIAAGIILCMVMIPILAFNCTLLLKTLTDPDHVPGAGGIFPLIVMSDSMYPEFGKGDILVCRTAKADELRKGDVIAYYLRTEDPESESGYTVVSHRIKDIAGKGGSLSFTTRGDANTADDPEKVSADDVLGKYSFRIKGLGRAVLFMKTVPGFLICVLLPLLILVRTGRTRERRR